MPSKLEALDVKTWINVWHFLHGDPGPHRVGWYPPKMGPERIHRRTEKAIRMCSVAMRTLFRDGRREDQLRVLRATLPPEHPTILHITETCGSSSA